MYRSTISITSHENNPAYNTLHRRRTVHEIRNMFDILEDLGYASCAYHSGCRATKGSSLHDQVAGHDYDIIHVMQYVPYAYILTLAFVALVAIRSFAVSLFSGVNLTHPP